ncbi:MAG: metal-dependent hydrolase [Candidatus Nanoarchaeia archaeon]
MLGRHHVSISIATILPFLIPFLFLNSNTGITYGIALIVAVMIGSLTPDADCGGKSKLYYDFRIVYDLMRPIQWLVVRVFRMGFVKSQLKIEEEIDNEHRGIMHTPIGIFISSILLTLILLLFILLIKVFDFIFVLVIFGGLVFGQFMHLLEDSCTVAGINWKFPFGKKELNGTIYTFSKIPGSMDIRPGLYFIVLISLSVLVFLGYTFNKINFGLTYLYLALFLVISVLWTLFILISKINERFWRMKTKMVSAIKKQFIGRRNLKKFEQGIGRL